MPLMMIWLTAFAACPAPVGPRCVIVLQNASRIGMAVANAASEPPTKAVQTPFFAPSAPPDSGASTTSTPLTASASASSFSALGETVEQSSSTAPSRTPSITPPSPRTTAIRSGVSDTHVTTTSVSRAASAGDSARRAPRATSSSPLAVVRFQTATSWPASSR